MPNLLVELGTEELPESALNVVYSELEKKTSAVLKQERLSFKEIRVEATPRRVSLYIEGLAAKQENMEEELSGPSVEKAYGADGKPTPALNGFLKSKRATPKEVITKDTPRGQYIVIKKKHVGKAAVKVLPEILQGVFGGLSFAKFMRWEKTGFKFPRPARWLVAIFDKKVIPFKFAGLKATNKTYGHRFLAPRAITLKGADWKLYEKALKKAHVILSLEERKKMIAKSLKGKYQQVSFDEELLHTAANLVEEPFMLDGKFSKSYLELPSEVLASCMKKNQKIFACYDGKDRLSGRFVGVLNGKRTGLVQIRAGYENVLDSRLKDARYFYKADTKEPFVDKLSSLEQVTFLGKLGNMLDRSTRLENLAEKFSEMIGRNDIKADLKRAALLSKIDLLTSLVYEFPDLQGIVGREYALESKEKEDVALAIGSQYLPKSLTESFGDVKKQMTPLGAMFGIIDRVDLLVGAFGTGVEPTGSQDPFALRRAGGSVVKIIRAFRFHFSLEELIEASTVLYGNLLTVDAKTLQSKLKKFFQERLVFETQVKSGMRPFEILQAVTRSSCDDLADVYERFETLTALYDRDPDVFIKAAKVVERTGNITKGAPADIQLDSGLLTETSEKQLYQLVEAKTQEIEGFLAKRDYEKATSRFGEIFYSPLHDFFEQVMVNVEDTALRATRQALMKRINHLYSERLADLSVLSRLDQG